MVTAATFSSIFSTPSSLGASFSKSSKTICEGPDNLDTRRVFAKSSLPSRGIQVKASAQASPKVNGTEVNLKMDTVKVEEEASSPSPRTFYNQLPDWSVLLAAITTVFLAAEKQWTLLDWKPKRPDMLSDAFSLGKIVQDGLVFRQNFSIRSYEIGADRAASIETLMNHLQETALNHVKSAGLLGDGFGATPEMTQRNLIWVVTKMHALVDHYPVWGDVVQVDTWVCASGKNGMRRDWHVCDFQTGKTITRATSVWVMMNKYTRRLSKMPEEVRAEIEPYFMEGVALMDEDNRKLPKLDEDSADHIRKGLCPMWGDLDVNQHVNNVKYIGWIVESAPVWILEGHELTSMTLEYRRECGRDSVLQSLTSISDDLGEDGSPETGLELNHLLRLECGAEIIRGRTRWRPKRSPPSE